MKAFLFLWLVIAIYGIQVHFPPESHMYDISSQLDDCLHMERDSSDGVVICTMALGAELSQTQKDKAHQYIMECMKQTAVKPEVLAEAKKGNFKNDEALQKFTLCFFQKSGIVDNNGKVNVDVALAKLPSGVDKTEAKMLLQECKKKTGKDAAEAAFEVFKCYSRGTKTHILV